MYLQYRLLPFAFTCLAGAAAFAQLTSAQSGDGSWPQWRGPELNGLTTETEWSTAGKEESLWETQVGLGYSSVVVHAGLLYTMDYDVDAGMDVVWCLDALTGEKVWMHAYPAKIWKEYHTGGTLTTPSLEGDAVYTLNREGNAYCLDAATGEVRWEKALSTDMDTKPGQWGFSGSPLVLKDQLLLNVGKVVSLDKKTGEVLWASEDFGDAYSTPAAFDWKGKPVLAVFNKSIALIDRAAGKTLMQKEWTTDYNINAATPIVIGDSIFITSGYNHGCARLALTDEGFETVWESRAMRTQMSGCVRIGDNIYGFDDKVLTCIGIDGEVRWSERGTGEGALMASPDRLVLLNGDGELVVAGATPAGYTEMSKAKLFDSGKMWTKPVLVGGVIYCRNSEGALIARDHRIAR